MGEHFSDIAEFVKGGGMDELNWDNSEEEDKETRKRDRLKKLSSDTFVRHFMEHFAPGQKISRKGSAGNYKNKVIWQGDPINFMKSFGKGSCKLCMENG